jgi:hypothetical protein
MVCAKRFAIMSRLRSLPITPPNEYSPVVAPPAEENALQLGPDLDYISGNRAGRTATFSQKVMSA